MSLPWFAFNADAYTGDTAHLTCEEHGAYLLLMLAYYRSEKPLPATDRALASICKLPMDRWLDCRPALAPFFVEAEGTWRHARIEEEIAQGHKRMERFSKRAKTASDARYKGAKGIHQASNNDDTLTLTKDSLSTRANDVLEEREPEQDPVVAEPPRAALSSIDMQFEPPPDVREECLKDADASTYHLEVQKFKYHHQAQGSLSDNWTASFKLWWTRFQGYRSATKPRGKPRVVLNLDHEADDKSKINWDWHMSRWLKNESSWSRRTAGAEPGQPGCRVPPEMFEKYGVDPATGRKKQTEKT